MWKPERGGSRLTAEQAGELEALDRMLAGSGGPGEVGGPGRLGGLGDVGGPGGLGGRGEVGGEQAGLAGLVTAVRDDRPALRPVFAADLDARVAAGFPRRADGGSGAAGRGWRRLETRHWLAGLGAIATLGVVVAVVAGQAGTGGDQPVGRPLLGEKATAPAHSVAPSAGAGASAPGVPSGGAATSAGPAIRSSVPAPGPGVPASTGAADARVVQRDAALSLLAPRGHVQEVTDRAIGATDRLGGIVESSNVALDDQGGSQASLELRVPGAALDRALAALSGLAHVSSRSQSALDITDATGAARDRLAESRAERDALLRALATATTANQVASIHARLGVVNGRIVADRGRLAGLQRRGTTAHLSVTIDEDQQAGVGGGSAWGPGAALDDAVSVLEAVFGVAVIALAVLVPAGVVGLLGWWASGPLRRRRREGALAGTVGL